MKMFIPACGDRIILTAPWTFLLYFESRNIEFAKVQGLLRQDARGDQHENGWRSPLLNILCTLPAGTVLECDRVYIRSFSKSALKEDKDYDSITWREIDPIKGKPKKNCRFWVKLSDCNAIEFRLEPDSLYRDRVKAVRLVQES